MSKDQIKKYIVILNESDENSKFVDGVDSKPTPLDESLGIARGKVVPLPRGSDKLLAAKLGTMSPNQLSLFSGEVEDPFRSDIRERYNEFYNSDYFPSYFENTAQGIDDFKKAAKAYLNSFMSGGYKNVKRILIEEFVKILLWDIKNRFGEDYRKLLQKSKLSENEKPTLKDYIDLVNENKDPRNEREAHTAMTGVKTKVPPEHEPPPELELVKDPEEDPGYDPRNKPPKATDLKDRFNKIIGEISSALAQKVSKARRLQSAGSTIKSLKSSDPEQAAMHSAEADRLAKKAYDADQFARKKKLLKKFPPKTRP